MDQIKSNEIQDITELLPSNPVPESELETQNVEILNSVTFKTDDGEELPLIQEYRCEKCAEILDNLSKFETHSCEIREISEIPKVPYSNDRINIISSGQFLDNNPKVFHKCAHCDQIFDTLPKLEKHKCKFHEITGINEITDDNKIVPCISVVFSSRPNISITKNSEISEEDQKNFEILDKDQKNSNFLKSLGIGKSDQSEQRLFRDRRMIKKPERSVVLNLIG